MRPGSCSTGRSAPSATTRWRRRARSSPQANVWMGQQKTVPLTVAKDLLVTLPVSERDKVQVKAIYDGPIAAPVAAGQPIGELVMTDPGHAGIPRTAGRRAGGAAARLRRPRGRHAAADDLRDPEAAAKQAHPPRTSKPTDRAATDAGAVRCRSNSSRSKAGRAAASRPSSASGRSAARESARLWSPRASPAGRPAPRKSAACWSKASPGAGPRRPRR